MSVRTSTPSCKFFAHYALKIFSSPKLLMHFDFPLCDLLSNSTFSSAILAELYSEVSKLIHYFYLFTLQTDITLCLPILSNTSICLLFSCILSILLLQASSKWSTILSSYFFGVINKTESHIFSKGGSFHSVSPWFKFFTTVFSLHFHLTQCLIHNNVKKYL